MGFLRRISLQYQIAAGVIPGLVVILFIFGWLAAQTIGETRDLALEGRLATAFASAHAIDEILVHEAEELQEAATLLATVDSLAEEQDLLTKIHAVIHEFTAIVRLDENGLPLWAVPATVDAAEWGFADDPDVVASLNEGQMAILRPDVATPSEGPLAVVTVPIQSANGVSLGFLAGELWASGSHHLIPLITLGEGTSAMLVDDRGFVIAQASDTPLTDDVWEPDTIAHLVESGQPGTTIDDDHGPSHVEAYHPLETFPAGIVVEERHDRALAIPNRLERNILWLGVSAVVVASCGVMLYSRSVVRPIRALTSASSKIAAGALDNPIHVKREDEVGQLANSFETMRQRLRESQEQSRRWEHELEARVRERTAQVQSLLGKVISAQEEERMRIARDLHDDSAQELVALLAGIQAAEAALPADPDKAGRVLAGIRPAAKRALEEMRKSILDLRPSALDDLGLAPAIRWYAESRLKPAIDLDWKAVSEFDDLGEPTVITLFRIAQEAVNNIARHSDASTASISLSSTDDTVAIDISDDGKGFDTQRLETSPADSRGLGILGMNERVGLLGGSVQITSKPGKGTSVRICVPRKAIE